MQMKLAGGLLLALLMGQGAYAQDAKTLTIAVPQEPPLFDICAMGSNAAARIIFGNIGEGLTQRDPASGEVKPLLATSWEQTSPTTWIFKLREGVTFQDGAPFNAEAAVTSITRTFVPELSCSVATQAFGAVPGGQESMSLAPHCQYLRGGTKMGPVTLVDTLLGDGLMDAFGGYHMGITAENVARQFGISRSMQDAFALASQQKAAAAQVAGRFIAEIVPVTVTSRKGDIVVDTDEYIRADASAEGLAKLRPAFDKDGSVTAGNASGLNDGAAALVLMHANEAARRGLTPLARIASWATAGVDPAIMGTGPVPASQKALAKAGWTAADLDLIEANEAFAAQACAVNQAMGWDLAKVNVNGGAIAIGHPIGASGARILVTLLHEMARRNASKGLATLCIGGGMGIAMCLERAL